MELVFLEAASALRLTKQITNKKTTPYPHVKKINSYHYQKNLKLYYVRMLQKVIVY